MFDLFDFLKLNLTLKSISLKHQKFAKYLGNIDGTYIRIRQPLRQSHAYANRKKFCAVTLQAVCKPNREFIDVSTGYPSSMHDANVFSHSNIGQNLTTLLAGTRYLLLADSAYGLSTRIMKPYRNNGGLSRVSPHFHFLFREIYLMLKIIFI